MKKIYALLIGVIVGSTAVAQSFDNAPAIKVLDKDQITPIIAPRGVIEVGSTLRATDILFEDFQAGGPDLPAGWGNTDVVTSVDGTLAGELAPAFIVGDATAANNGGYWPVPDFPGNTFAQANDDGDPCDCDMVLVELTTPEMDFSAAVNPALSFDLFHDQGFGGGDGGVNVSIDGGISWQVVVDVLPVDESVWQTIIVPLYDYQGEGTVMVQFFWSDAGSWASGFAIDNVGVGSLADYNAAADKAVFGNWNLEEFGAGVYDYSRVPLSQVSPVMVSSVVSNNGFNDLTDVSFEVEVFQDGASQGVWPSDQTSATLLSLDKDTLSSTTDYTPTIGDVSFEVTVMNMTGDDDAADDMAGASMMVTANTYARDADGAQAFVDPGTSYQFGNLFDIYVDEMCGGIEYACGAGTEEGAYLSAWVYDFEGFDDNGDPIFGNEFFETVEYEVTAADLNGVAGNAFVTLPFSDGAEMLTGGKTYLAVIATSGGEAVRTPVSGTNLWPASLLFDGEWGWTLSIPMLRLNMDASIAVNEVDGNEFALMQNIPNPAVDNTRIYYHLDAANQVNFQVVDMLGKIITSEDKGNQQSGSHWIDLDVSNFAAGVYTYSLIVGNNIETKQMIVR